MRITHTLMLAANSWKTSDRPLPYSSSKDANEERVSAFYCANCFLDAVKAVPDQLPYLLAGETTVNCHVC